MGIKVNNVKIIDIIQWIVNCEEIRNNIIKIIYNTKNIKRKLLGHIDMCTASPQKPDGHIHVKWGVEGEGKVSIDE